MTKDVGRETKDERGVDTENDVINFQIFKFSNLQIYTNLTNLTNPTNPTNPTTSPIVKFGSPVSQ